MTAFILTTFIFWNTTETTSHN